MSTNESIRETSPGKSVINEQGIPPHAEPQHNPRRPKPLPFDDGGGAEEVVQPTDPQSTKIDPMY